jgi:AraC-like DNA-binding protein
MNQVLFNFHDLILLMTALLCVCFAALLIATNPPKNISNYFLACFLFAHAFIPLHELVLWGATFKITARENFPNIIFVGGFAYYIDAVLLYFYVKSLVFHDFRPTRKEAYHLIPLMLFAFFMLVVFYRFPFSKRIEWINTEMFVYSKQYITADFLCKMLRVFYCVASFGLILKYRSMLTDTRSHFEKINILWLKILVIGFLAVTILEAILSVTKFIGLMTHFDFQHYSLALFEFIGLSGYYALFVLVVTLVFTSMRYFVNFDSVTQPKEVEQPKKPIPEKLLNPEFAQKIDSSMRSNKHYLLADITLDMLAEKLDMPPKDLSMIINRHFNSNFYEFINGYRIEEAKHLLIDPKNKHKTITDIYLEVGFNSKSVFNTFFKKIVGTTPSEFRHQKIPPL